MAELGERVCWHGGTGALTGERAHIVLRQVPQCCIVPSRCMAVEEEQHWPSVLALAG